MANLGTQTSDWYSDGSLAYGLFRFTFGLNIKYAASLVERPPCSRKHATQF
jgi:hypothetical protein